MLDSPLGPMYGNLFSDRSQGTLGHPMSLVKQKAFCMVNKGVQCQPKFASLNSSVDVCDDGWGNCLIAVL